MEEHTSKQPLLISPSEITDEASDITLSHTSFVAEADDTPPISGIHDFFREFTIESKKLWYLAGPAIFTSLCKYSLGAVTQTFAGHVGTLELAAVSIENSVIAGFSFGVMLGMGSALETLCGQAYGAGQIDMLGVYMQRSWVILNSTAVILMLLYIFAGQFLRLIGQTDDISREAGKMALYMIPQLFAYAMNFPIVKFLQVRLSLASAVMLCLETWYFMALVLFAGYLKNAEVAVDALCICMNILGWAVMAAMGCNAAIRQYPNLFAESESVKRLVYELTPLLAFCMVVNNIQPALSGVAIGAGWQALVAYVNIACYYLFGIPLGLILGYKFNMGVQGIWYGMVSGTMIQTFALFWIVYKTNWNNEASIAAERIKMWGGKPNDAEK
ncbi:hypothetical protein RND71_023881 [Anisodus tanguticus]|uniref:Protein DETOXIFICATION n=1 Tax=Anisodus tanguticus TaxID=243964 RepID=A0AAE1VC04_9SOLA|nr:hypothetical protein RND71_023881 [Anisodus tanguticus]